MTEPFQVGQFAIVDHEPVDRGPNAGTFLGKGPAGDRAELYILAEGTTPAGESFAGHIVSAAGQSWETLDMSLTGALRRLFQEATASIRDWNQKSIAQHRVSLGMVCFARRGNQAVIAQQGPSVAFHRHGNRVRAYFSDEEHGQPLGAHAAAGPQLTRVTIDPGDRLLLISTRALAELDDALVAGILNLPSQQQVIANLFRRLHHLRNVTVLVVGHELEGPSSGLLSAGAEAVIDATGTAAPGATVGGAGKNPGFQPSLFVDDGDAQAGAARRNMVDIATRTRDGRAALPRAMDVPAPLRRVAGENVLAALAAERQARAAAHDGTLPGFPLAGGAWSTASHGEMGRGRGRGGSFSRGLVRSERPPAPPIASAAPPVDILAEQHRARAVTTGPVSGTIATESSVSVASGGALVRVRDRAHPKFKGSRTLGGGGSAIGRLPPTWAIIIGGLAVLVGVVGVIAVPRILDGDTGREYNALVDAALQNVAIAQTLPDASERRARLREAQAMLLEARELPEASSELDRDLDSVRSALAELDAVHSPSRVESFADLGQFGDQPVSVKRIYVHDGTAYLLDTAGGQVISVDLGTGQARAVFKPGDGRGRAVATAWVGDRHPGAPSLLIADSNRSLWAYSPGAGLRSVPFGANASMSVLDIAIFEGDLYVLDNAGTAVWRLPAGEGGYLSPVRVLEAPELATAQRLLVDGEIITSHTDGTIHRFAGELALELSEAGIDMRLTSPEPPQALDRGEIAIADPANNRIVVLRRDGTFDRQYRHDDFAGLTGFSVSADGAWVFSGGHLRRVTW